MKHKIGTICMILGAVMVFASLALFVWNQREDAKAGEAVEEILPQVVEQIAAQENDPESPATLPDPYDPTMTEVDIEGKLYVGYLSIPAIGIELPVMSTWSYDQLKTAPCRYSGSTKTDDLVVCAHNYTRHFGQLKNLSPDDTVTFTDMDGIVTAYTVVTVETLQPTAIEEMTSGEYDLTLFTCTYGGATRVTVRCERAAG